MRTREWVGLHGVVLRSRRPASAARTWIRQTGLPLLFRGRNRIVLGFGPELFVEIRPAGAADREGIEKLHFAVRDLDGWRDEARSDELGADHVSLDVDGVAVEVRQFCRAPGRAWRRARSRRTR